MEQIAVKQQALCRNYTEGHIRKPQDSERERMREEVCSFVLLDKTLPRRKTKRKCKALQQMVLDVLFQGRDTLQRSWEYRHIETEIANLIQEVNMSEATVLPPDVRDKVVSHTVHWLYLLKPDAPIQPMKKVRQDQEKVEPWSLSGEKKRQPSGALSDELRIEVIPELSKATKIEDFRGTSDFLQVQYLVLPVAGSEICDCPVYVSFVKIEVDEDAMTESADRIQFGSAQKKYEKPQTKFHDTLDAIQQKEKSLRAKERDKETELARPDFSPKRLRKLEAEIKEAKDKIQRCEEILENFPIPDLDDNSFAMWCAGDKDGNPLSKDFDQNVLNRAGFINSLEHYLSMLHHLPFKVPGANGWTVFEKGSKPDTRQKGLPQFVQGARTLEEAEALKVTVSKVYEFLKAHASDSNTNAKTKRASQRLHSELEDATFWVSAALHNSENAGRKHFNIKGSFPQKKQYHLECFEVGQESNRPKNEGVELAKLQGGQILRCSCRLVQITDNQQWYPKDLDRRYLAAHRDAVRALMPERVQQEEREKCEQLQRHEMEQIAVKQQALCRNYTEGHIRKPQDSERERMREEVCSFVLLDKTLPRRKTKRKCKALQQMVLDVLFQGRDTLQRSWEYRHIETEIANLIQEVNMSEATVLPPDVRDKVVSHTVHWLYLLKPDAPIQPMKKVRQDQEKADLSGARGPCAGSGSGESAEANNGSVQEVRVGEELELAGGVVTVLKTPPDNENVLVAFPGGGNKQGWVAKKHLRQKVQAPAAAGASQAAGPSQNPGMRATQDFGYTSAPRPNARYVPGDGKCQFHAVALAEARRLHWDDDLLQRSSELRMMAIEELRPREKRDQYEPFFSSEETQASTYDEYLGKLEFGEGQGSQGSHITLQALTNSCRTGIHRISVVEDGKADVDVVGNANPEGAALTIFLDNPNTTSAHYWALVD